MTKLETVNDYIAAGLTHSLHTSESRSFRSCRRRWNWIFRERYYPLVTPRPLEFGVAYHKAMEVYYDPRSWDEPGRVTAQALAIMAFRDVVREQRQSFIQMNGTIDPEMDEDYKDRVSLGVGMLKYYFREVSPQLDKGFRPVKVEVPFEVPIMARSTGTSISCKCNLCHQEMVRYWRKQGHSELDISRLLTPNWDGLPVTYGGRIDMLAEDEDGGYWVFDWKTAARLSGVDQGTEDDFLYFDDQITRYCWALWTLGINVRGFIYHEQKKAFPMEPELLARPRLGAIFSKNRQFPTTYEIYRRTVSENDPTGFEAGVYNDHLEWLKLQGFRFENRRQIIRNETELINCGYELFLEASDIVDPNLRLYKSSGRFSCSSCAFQQPCLGMNRGEDYQYALDTMFEKRERHYWQKQESSTDKPMRG